jgi:biofilm PGA synthesis N-glycosyltransferase PgaC
MLIFIALASLWLAILLPPIAYYAWMFNNRKKNSIQTNSEYSPFVSLIVATYNEAAVIQDKLENIQKIDYPPDKLLVIIVDSNSNDGTLDICREYLSRNSFRFPIQLLSESERLGKSHALNFALQYAKGEVIATSDADSFWNSDALRKAVSFLSDPSVGVVTGREDLLNVNKNVNTLSEGAYKGFFNTLRLGESNIHSTLLIQGELALYKRTVLTEFEDKPGYPDDNGTALKVISNGYRCIYVPDAVFHDKAPVSLRARLQWKSRRAEHLIACIIQAFKLKKSKSLPLPWGVVFSNFYLHIISPLVLVIALIVTASVYIVEFQYIWFLSIMLFPFIFKKLRVFAIAYLTSNYALIKGISMQFSRKRQATWTKIEEMRK